MAHRSEQRRAIRNAASQYEVGAEEFPGELHYTPRCEK
jgi:hypothetical protein